MLTDKIYERLKRYSWYLNNQQNGTIARITSKEIPEIEKILHENRTLKIPEGKELIIQPREDIDFKQSHEDLIEELLQDPNPSVTFTIKDKQDVPDDVIDAIVLNPLYQEFLKNKKNK